MAVALASIRTDIYTTIYNHLQTGSYAITTNNIHPYFNRLQRVQENYPQVIILAPLVAPEDLTFGSGSTFSVPVVVRIDVYHNSSANAKSVADEVSNKIITGRDVLRTAGLKRVKFEPDDEDDDPISAIQATHIYHLAFKCEYVGAT